MGIITIFQKPTLKSQAPPGVLARGPARDGMALAHTPRHPKRAVT